MFLQHSDYKIILETVKMRKYLGKLCDLKWGQAKWHLNLKLQFLIKKVFYNSMKIFDSKLT